MTNINEQTLGIIFAGFVSIFFAFVFIYVLGVIPNRKLKAAHQAYLKSLEKPMPSIDFA